jgi:ABC-type branched-subunit amino acid transport system substrate-binding protein
LEQGVLLSVAKAKEKGPAVNAVVRGAVGQWGADGVEAARIVTDDQAKGLIAPPSGAGSHLALQVAGRTAVPVISLCPDSSVTRTGVPWMVRVSPRTVDEVLALLRGMNLKGQGTEPARWTVVVPPGRAGREIARDIARGTELAQAPLPTTIELSWPAADMGSCSRTVARNHPQIILIWLDPVPAAGLVKSLRALGFEGRLGGPGSLRCSEFVEAAGEVLREFQVPAPVLSSADQSRYKQFCADYRARFGRKPDYMAAMSYDAASLLIYSLGMAGQKPAHEVFPLAFAFPGVTGMLRFDNEGNRQVELQLINLRASRAESNLKRGDVIGGIGVRVPLEF